MDVSKIPPGRNPPDDINAVIEIPQGGVPVKYELDKVSSALFVNRFLHTANVLSGKLWLHPEHTVGRSRSM